MTEREERRFADVPRESVKLMAKSSGVELSEEVAALLAEDVCYRLREATQNSSQFMRHAKRRKLSVEDFNRALQWSNTETICGFGAQDALPFRPLKEGELFFVEDREINLVELALATNIPKGCAETMVRVNVSYLDGKGNLEPQGTVPTAVQSLSDDLLKYYQQITRAILGEDPHLMKVALLDLQSNSKIAALLPYFVYVISGVKSVSHDLDQLNRLLHMVKSLVQNPYLYLGSYVRSLVSSVMYCILEPLAASINPLNDHWTLRDYAALLLSHIFWTHGDLVSGLYHQIILSLQKVLSDPVRPLCSHYGAVVGLHALGWKAVERVLYPHLPAYWANLQAVLDDYSVSNAQVKADGHKVYGAILVAVERLLKMKALSLTLAAGGGNAALQGSVVGALGFRESSPGLSPPPEPLSEPPLGIASHLQTGGAGCPWEDWTPISLPGMYCELYSFFGDSLALRFSTDPPLGGAPPAGSCPPLNGRKEPASGAANLESTRKMPQLTASMNISPQQDGSPRTEPQPPSLAATVPGRSLARSSSSSSSVSRSRSSSSSQSRDIFPKARFHPPQAGPPVFSFIIGGRQMGRRCQGRRFQTSFTPTPPLTSLPPRAYAHKLPVIGRFSKPVCRWTCSHYSLHLPL
ncbi:TAF6-like RNA polymerase II p300/CBP-associated factor-associated factor 65 kDa subunit 6L [Myxocyprinus asiaticus]|uniref:TAF6-like RNA polymerase II p300/CBP-associated factor-associated factor 65 kDa subunit 6L n=1 Tax=Myxocyprinus asiaticus TaxID=70543 RepID=UPI0022231C53|nr:TAF6-like RNA polymerase II p300/CBP-associated factor-associated factor 65 kDa subunit 6L [Myxocyprinus asiaticus]XP_051562583.1 TAF6-like RNA polymerase II p300/CBP-associated factor-associated factor 65 kDa subunit 6L [Myxocyprinus asiaticus]XP_051562591.1 TAF6-like RNA polymerase II p300/CBP-associated factor-associated factor 65 kDa subunit 6L [Myxocyprinus asiaticus]